MYKLSKFLKQCVVLSMVFFSASALAVDPINTSFFSDQAIKGYDSVAYFTQNKAVKGKSEFSTEYQGAKWLFSSQANLELFTANPSKYAPQYGGYCAYAVSQGYTASIKPELFTIHEGKLYLNYNADVNNKWRNNKLDFISKADKNWPEILKD